MSQFSKTKVNQSSYILRSPKTTRAKEQEPKQGKNPIHPFTLSSQSSYMEWRNEDMDLVYGHTCTVGLTFCILGWIVIVGYETQAVAAAEETPMILHFTYPRALLAAWPALYLN
jgi:hypothetical protein